MCGCLYVLIYWDNSRLHRQYLQTDGIKKVIHHYFVFQSSCKLSRIFKLLCSHSLGTYDWSKHFYIFNMKKMFWITLGIRGVYRQHSKHHIFRLKCTYYKVKYHDIYFYGHSTLSASLARESKQRKEAHWKTPSWNYQTCVKSVENECHKNLLIPLGQHTE